MHECVFCRLVNHQIPAWVDYQDEAVVCFLPNPPEVFGHTLVVPKQHFADIYTTPEAVLGSLMTVTKKLALHYQTQVGASGINILHASGKSAQQSVFHFHLHVLPRFEADGLNTWPAIPATDINKDELLLKLKLPH